MPKQTFTAALFKWQGPYAVQTGQTHIFQSCDYYIECLPIDIPVRAFCGKSLPVTSLTFQPDESLMCQTCVKVENSK